MSDSFDFGEKNETYMLLDLSNHMHRCRHGAKHGNKGDDNVNEYAMHIAITALNRLYNELQPTKIVACVDYKSWRKEIFPMYKERRHEDREKDEGFALFVECMNEFKELIRLNSSIIFLESEMVEADDWIARWTQTHPDDNHIICSTDGDFHQLHSHNIKQFNPIKHEYINVEDPKFAIFLKAIRGETGRSSDNIPSAYPRVRQKKLEDAFYRDTFLMESIMQETVYDIAVLDDKGVPSETTVRKLYERNLHLMDLTDQPTHIIDQMDEIIKTAHLDVGKYNMFKVLTYLGKNNLNKIGESIEQYSKWMML